MTSSHEAQQPTEEMTMAMAMTSDAEDGGRICCAGCDAEIAADNAILISGEWCCDGCAEDTEMWQPDLMDVYGA